MNLQYRIDLLTRLGEYILSDDAGWKAAKEKASQQNGWFIPEFIELAAKNIAGEFLQKGILEKWTVNLKSKPDNYRDKNPKRTGIVMAGNIPLVGFHDFLSVFVSGHKAIIKTSSKDETLIKHLTGKLIEWESGLQRYIQFEEMLKGCDAYIATGSRNSFRYFEHYFGKYPHIIRRNKTSVAVLSGNETMEDLEKLADDVCLFFGLGCRNVTKIYVPENYDFVPLLEAFKKYNWMADHHKYKNNYDYTLALHMLGNKYYMTNGSVILVQEKSVFSPVSQLNYEAYQDINELKSELKRNPDLQCIAGKGFIAFGGTQCPAIDMYADGTDTLKFLSRL
jgi:hypothetical protein